MDGEDVNNEDVTLSGTPGHSTISDTITVEELDRRQYENDLELVRIELESKKLQLESQKERFTVNSEEVFKLIPVLTNHGATSVTSSQSQSDFRLLV